MKMWGSLSVTLQLLPQEAESTGAPRFNGFRKDLFGKPRGALLNFIDEGTNSFTPTKKGNFYWSPLIDGWVGACLH